MKWQSAVILTKYIDIVNANVISFYSDYSLHFYVLIYYSYFFYKIFRLNEILISCLVTLALEVIKMSEENKNDNKRKIIKYFGRDCYYEETENEKIITEIRTKENQKIVTHVFS